MRLLALPLVIPLLTACQTPAAIRTSGALIAKFSTQMDSSITQYVAALNDGRSADASRLQAITADTARVGGVNGDQLEIWSFSNDAQGQDVIKVLTAIKATAAAEPSPLAVLMPVTAASSQAKLSFDDTPLKTIEGVAATIAQPDNSNDQLKVFASFAQTVQGDLKSTSKTPTSANAAKP
jgi:hypothetical protein